MDKKILLGGILAATSMMFVTNANAALSIVVDTGISSTTLTDANNDGIIAGLAMYDGWLINLTALGVDFYKDFSPLDKFDHMHYDSVDVSGGAGTLTLSFIETGLVSTPSPFSVLYGGVFADTVSFASYVDGVEVTNSGDLSGSASNLSEGGNITASSPFTWTTVATVTHSAGQTTSFNYDVKIPEPSTVALLGLGMIGMGFAARRRRKEG